jgi:hypothetical protein
MMATSFTRGWDVVLYGDLGGLQRVAEDRMSRRFGRARYRRPGERKASIEGVNNRLTEFKL